MIFNDPTTLTILISIFFVIAAASVAFAVAAVTGATRERRTAPVLASASPASVRRVARVPARHAA